MSLLNQEMTDHDLAAWMDDLLTRIELRVLMEHEVIDHQGDDAGSGGVDGAQAAPRQSGLRVHG
jgi:hypothetical protein